MSVITMPCSTLFLSMLKWLTLDICSKSTFCSKPPEFCALINRITESIGDVVIDVPLHPVGSVFVSGSAALASTAFRGAVARAAQTIDRHQQRPEAFMGFSL